MSVIFGHPTGNPNSYHAALAHFESGRLEAFCVPWMPTPVQLRTLQILPGLGEWKARLRRRCFLPLLNAPRIEGRAGEWRRMIKRIIASRWADDRLSYEANDWLMRTMARECGRSRVTVVHSYEDCSLWQFEVAKRLGKICLYDMPIGYYPVWEDRLNWLTIEYAEWVPDHGVPSSRYVRPEQKRREMELADLVLAPSSFVQKTIQEHIDKKVARAPYGVDLEFWAPVMTKSNVSRNLRFIYAGQCSLRKGTHLLLQAWQAANLKDATLELVGLWQLSEKKKRYLPPNVQLTGPVSRDELRSCFRSADVFVFPSYFEGFGLVLLEAMACGLPAIATTATAGPDILDEMTGRIIKEGDLDQLVESLRWFATNRDRLPSMRDAARRKAETFTWEHYRDCVSRAVAPYVGGS